MIKIMLVHAGYNWNSYSTVRTAHDIVKEREDIKCIVDENDLQSGSYVWSYGCQLVLYKDSYLELKKRGVTVVNFNLSDPNWFNEERFKRCDVYCTNDLNTYRKYFYKAYSDDYVPNYRIYHFPVGVDLKNFVKIDVNKNTDVLFVGTLKHMLIPMRKPYIMKLREEIFDFKSYGHGFERFLEGENLIEAYNRTHLNLDICTKVSSLASRIFQAAACGVPTLTLKRDDVLECFEDRKEIITYEGGYDEMVYKMVKALQNKDRLAEIGENARKRCIAEHGMRKRVDDLIKYLGENNENS